MRQLLLLHFNCLKKDMVAKEYIDIQIKESNIKMQLQRKEMI